MQSSGRRHMPNPMRASGISMTLIMPIPVCTEFDCRTLLIELEPFHKILLNSRSSLRIHSSNVLSISFQVSIEIHSCIRRDILIKISQDFSTATRRVMMTESKASSRVESFPPAWQMGKLSSIPFRYVGVQKNIAYEEQMCMRISPRVCA